MVNKEKNLKSNIKGITLVSLVITIVIMLILAGVSISFIIGNNGLFGKANDGTKKYSKEAAREELQNGYVSIDLDRANNNDDITDEYIKQEMSKSISGIQWIDNDEDMILGQYKNYVFDIENGEIIIKDNFKLEYSYIKNTSTKTTASNTTDPYFWGYRNYIHNIKIVSKENPREYINSIISNNVEISTGKETADWDLSTTGDDSVIAYSVKSSNSDYDLYIVGKGKIVLPADCSYFFAYFYNLSSITGFENVSAKHVKNMDYMFCDFGKNSLVTFDLGDNFDTSNVTSMNNTFERTGMNLMTSFRLGAKFNTSKVISMENMFHATGNDVLENLDLNLDTSSAQNMNSMFYCCGGNKLKTLKVGNNFTFENITNTISSVFRYCGSTTLLTLDLGQNCKLKKSSVASGALVFRNINSKVTVKIPDETNLSDEYQSIGELVKSDDASYTVVNY